MVDGLVVLIDVAVLARQVHLLQQHCRIEAGLVVQVAWDNQDGRINRHSRVTGPQQAEPLEVAHCLFFVHNLGMA